MEKEIFTMEAALEIQTRQLEDIKTVLNAETYEALKQHVDEKNEAGYDSPYKVFRGQDLDSFVSNLASQNGRALRNR